MSCPLKHSLSFFTNSMNFSSLAYELNNQLLWLQLSNIGVMSAYCKTLYIIQVLFYLLSVFLFYSTIFIFQVFPFCNKWYPISLISYEFTINGILVSVLIRRILFHQCHIPRCVQILRNSKNSHNGFQNRTLRRIYWNVLFQYGLFLRCERKFMNFIWCVNKLKILCWYLKKQT